MSTTMSKIQAYQEAKGQLHAFQQFVNSASQPDCDKFGATVTIGGDYKGYYGNSSCYGWPDLVLTMTAKDFQGQFFNSFRRSLERLSKEVEQARKAAENEAREVLQATGELKAAP